MDPDDIAERVGRDVNWRGKIRRLDLNVIAGRDVGSGHSCWKGWKGGQLDPDVVAGRVLEGTAIGRDVGRCC